MGKTIFRTLKESAKSKPWLRSVVGRPDRPGQFTHLTKELPRNLAVLSEYRKKRESGETS